MFRGSSSINLDAKGRLAMPSRYRQELDERCEGQMVITIDLHEPCLCLYPLDEWEPVETQIRSMSSMLPEARRLQRLTAALRKRHPLRAVRGHEHIAPGRKTDPGPAFDWTRMGREGNWSQDLLPRP